MSGRLTQQQLESYLWGAATLLRGLVDAGDYKQFIFPLLFYKRLSDVWDEDYASAFLETGDDAYAKATADDRFVIPDGSHWKETREVPKSVGKAIRDASDEKVNSQRYSAFGHPSYRQLFRRDRKLGEADRGI